jgi:hypothetical protein
LLSVPSSASAAVRSVLFTYRYPSSGNYAGVALYYAASRADVAAGMNLTRIDLGLRPVDSQGLVNAMLPGFDDARDYYVVLRCYDSAGGESANSDVGVIAASVVATTSSTLYQENFESYAPGADPAAWIDSAPGAAAPGDATLFETTRLSDGSMAFGAAASVGDIHSHLDASGAGSWSSYEYSGRIESDLSVGRAGVTVLSQYPDAQFYYRLARVGAAYSVVKRGGDGTLTCAGSASTGVIPSARAWLRFRVRVTRFDGRNRVRASLWPDGGSAPSNWQADCWDSAPEGNATGRVGLFSWGNAGNHWDDLRVDSVSADGAPPGYGATPPPTTPPPVTPPPTPPPTTPPPSGGSGGGVSTYASASQLAHWWLPGWDVADLGRDFAPSGGVDASDDAKGLSATDVTAGGSSSAQIDLDGTAEALGNYALRPYGVGNTWSLAVWVRPGGIPSKGPRYIFDLNGQQTIASVSRISLTLDAKGLFGIGVTDSAGNARAIVASTSVNASQMPNAWYYVVAVKSGTSSLALFVNGVQVASTNVGVPAQGDVPRVLRIGGRVKDSTGFFWKGGIGSVALWHSPLASSEVKALWATGNRGADLR